MAGLSFDLAELVGFEPTLMIFAINTLALILCYLGQIWGSGSVKRQGIGR